MNQKVYSIESFKVDLTKEIDVEISVENVTYLSRRAFYIIIALLAIAAAISFVFLLIGCNRKSGALYGENCNSTSCDSHMGLECFNGICGCDSDSYYEKGCKHRISYKGRCNSNSQNCDSNMMCINGLCNCDSSSYWSNGICVKKRTFNESCDASDNECLSDSMLHCDVKNKKCICKDGR